MKNSQSSLRLQIIVLTITRLTLNIGSRMVYPFLATFARGLGVEPTAISLAITSRSFTGALSPLFTPIADRFGRKTGILLGIGIATLGFGWVAFFPSYPSFFIALSLGFLGLYVYMGSTHAYLGDQVDYEKRGRAMAIPETGWSLSFIVAMPLVALLIARFGWHAPFPLLTGLGVIVFALIALVIPKNSRAPRLNGGTANLFRDVIHSPVAIACVSLTLLSVAANEVVNLVFGIWMGDSFGLNLSALGAASAVIGIAELSAELLSGGVVDRLGKERSIRIGLIINGLVALALTWLGQNLWSAMVGLFLFYLTFEFVSVSTFPLITEVLPGARATLMGVNVAAICLGRAVGDLVAPFIYYHWGFLVNGLLAIVFDVLALLIFSRVNIHSKSQVPIVAD
ncbi:MAG TPA: MFS transporter [Anaerolineaceae bacterium]|nr:MFS transporter [Anaerolineaceae bacterium]